jgi:hypothetical protein
MCPHATICAVIPLYLNYICPYTTILIYVSLHTNIFKHTLTSRRCQRHCSGAQHRAVQERIAPVDTIYTLYMCPHTIYYICVLIRSCHIRSSGASRRGTGGRGISALPTPSASRCCAVLRVKVPLLPTFMSRRLLLPAYDSQYYSLCVYLASSYYYVCADTAMYVS